MSIEERIYNGDRAREVLDNEQFQWVFEEVERTIVESWRNTPSTLANREPRERLHLSLTLLGKIKATLEQSLTDGKIAMQQLEHKRTLAERARGAISGIWHE